MTRNLQIIKKAMANRQMTRTAKQQIAKSTDKLTNHISQFWLHVHTFLALNRALFYLMQDSCTRKNVQESTTHSQVSCTSQLVQVSCTRFLTVCHQHWSLKVDNQVWWTSIYNNKPEEKSRSNLGRAALQSLTWDDAYIYCLSNTSCILMRLWSTTTCCCACCLQSKKITVTFLQISRKCQFWSFNELHFKRQQWTLFVLIY